MKALKKFFLTTIALLISLSSVSFEMLLNSTQAWAQRRPSRWEPVAEIKNIAKFTPTTHNISVSRDLGEVWELSLTSRGNSIKIHRMHIIFADDDVQLVDPFDLARDEFQIVDVQPQRIPYIKRLELVVETSNLTGSRADLIIEAR